MDASLVGAPVFKTVCVALILSQVGSIPTHLRHVCEDCYDVDNVYEKNLSTSTMVHLFWYTLKFPLANKIFLIVSLKFKSKSNLKQGY